MQWAPLNELTTCKMQDVLWLQNSCHCFHLVLLSEEEEHTYHHLETRDWLQSEMVSSPQNVCGNPFSTFSFAVPFTIFYISLSSMHPLSFCLSLPPSLHRLSFCLCLHPAPPAASLSPSVPTYTREQKWIVFNWHPVLHYFLSSFRRRYNVVPRFTQYMNNDWVIL